MHSPWHNNCKGTIFPNAIPILMWRYKIILELQGLQEGDAIPWSATFQTSYVRKNKYKKVRIENFILNENSFFFGFLVFFLPHQSMSCSLQRCSLALDQSISWLCCIEAEVSNCSTATLIGNALMYSLYISVCVCLCAKHFSRYLLTCNILRTVYPIIISHDAVTEVTPTIT